MICEGICHTTYAVSLVLCQQGHHPGRVFKGEVARKGLWLPPRNRRRAADSCTGWGPGHGRQQFPCSYVRESRNEIVPMRPG